LSKAFIDTISGDGEIKFLDNCIVKKLSVRKLTFVDIRGYISGQERLKCGFDGMYLIIIEISGVKNVHDIFNSCSI